MPLVHLSGKNEEQCIVAMNLTLRSIVLVASCALDSIEHARKRELLECEREKSKNGPFRAIQATLYKTHNIAMNKKLTDESMMAQ
jgi:hypothetical protein